MMNNCLECATKHITMARIQYDEYRQDNKANISDLINCIGNLGCAETHIIDSHPEVCSAIREARKTIMSDNYIDINLFDELVLLVCKVSGLVNRKKLDT